MPAKIAVLIYSIWGHLDELAQSVIQGAREAGAQVDVYQFPEILSDEVLVKMKAAPKLQYPIIKPTDLIQYDGILMGFGTRYGARPAAVSAFFDQTGGIWAKGELLDKFAGIFTGTASQHGGQETTQLTTIPFLAHQGIIFVPIGYGASELNDEKEIVGGSPYGAAYVMGSSGSRGVSESDRRVGVYQGKHFAMICNTFVEGKEALATKGIAAKDAHGPLPPTAGVEA